MKPALAEAGGGGGGGGGGGVKDISMTHYTKQVTLQLRILKTVFFFKQPTVLFKQPSEIFGRFTCRKLEVKAKVCQRYKESTFSFLLSIS